MSRDIAKTGPGVFKVTRASAELQRILDRRAVVPDYGGDDGLEGGGDFQRGHWIPPEWVDIRERDEAALRLHELKRGMEPEAEAWIVDFLNVIWVGTRHAADQKFEAVAMVYPRLLRQFPKVCWTEPMLDKAVLKFVTFFPSAGELAEFFLSERKRLEDEISAHEVIVKTTTKKPGDRPKFRPWAEGGAEDNAQWNREQADRERKELVEILRKRDEEAGRTPADTNPPARFPLEEGKAYVARLVAYTRDQISLGAAARRFDEARIKAVKDAALQPAQAVKTAKAEFRKTHEHGPPLPPGEDTSVCHGERLAGMAPDFTSEDEP